MTEAGLNITEPVRRAARLNPEAIAIVRADHGTISYGELDRAIDRMTVYLDQLGVRMGDICGLTILPPDEAPALILALALARMGVASADPTLPADRMRLCFQQTMGTRPVEPGRVAFGASWLADAAPAPVAAMHEGGDALCRIFASSGTTGQAKYVPVSHALMSRRVTARLVTMPGGRATSLIAVGLGGAWGFVAALRTLWLGGTIVLFDPRDPIAAIRCHGVTAISAPPIALRSILDAMPRDADPLPMLETLEVGGSVVPSPLLHEAMARLSPNITICLGSTEAGGVSAAPVAALGSRKGAVGLLFPGIRAEAVDPDHNRLPDGTEGILRLRGDTVADGYLEAPDTSPEGFRDGWFYPGDLGSVWPDGMLCLTGRASEIINIGGVKLSPMAIENGLLGLPGVTDAAAFGVPDASGVEQIWAAIVAASPIEDDVLEAYCDRAPKGQAPRVIVQMEALPRNQNGKIQRDVLAAMAARLSGDA